MRYSYFFLFLLIIPVVSASFPGTNLTGKVIPNREILNVTGDCIRLNNYTIAVPDDMAPGNYTCNITYGEYYELPSSGGGGSGGGGGGAGSFDSKWWKNAQNKTNVTNTTRPTPNITNTTNISPPITTITTDGGGGLIAGNTTPPPETLTGTPQDNQTKVIKSQTSTWLVWTFSILVMLVIVAGIIIIIIKKRQDEQEKIDTAVEIKGEDKNGI